MRRRIGVVLSWFLMTFLSRPSTGQQVNSFSDLYLLSKDIQGEPFCLTDTPSAVFDGVRSRLRCVVKCSESNPECTSANYHDVTRKCELFYYPSVQPLKIADQCKNYKKKDTPTAVDFCKPTGDNSTFPTQSCSLPFTYQGQLYYSCAKGGCYKAKHTWVTCDPSVSFTAGYVKANVIIPNIVQPAATTFIQGWLIIHFNALSVVGAFRRTWVEYRDGIGNLDGTYYWYGNEKVHQLTTSSGSWKLRVEVLSSSNSKWYSAEYESFWLSDEASKYKLNVTGYSGDAGDGFNDGQQANHHVNGMKFSTGDSDNDKSPKGNCATDFGWWMNWCGSSILTQPDKTNSWYSLKSTKMASSYYVSKARMMMRRNY